MKVGITGASGFVGGAIARAFAAAGWSVVPLGRREPARYDLADAVDPASIAGLDALVHAAYSPGCDNVAALVRLRDAVRTAGIEVFTFVSSFAADANAASAYGREKHRAEAALDVSRDLIVRPGLVAGNGGLYASIRLAIARYGLAPVFGDGKQPVYLVDADELASAIVALVEGSARGLYACAAPDPIGFRDLCLAIGLAMGRRVRCIGVPTGLALALVSLVERLGLRPPVSSESVRGIANLRLVDVPVYAEIGHAFSTPAEAIRRAERAFA